MCIRDRHEIVGLVGANGCGKTTIGKLIAGLYRPSGGRIMLFGKSQNPKQLQKQVLFILQEAEFQFFTGSVQMCIRDRLTMVFIKECLHKGYNRRSSASLTLPICPARRNHD